MSYSIGAQEIITAHNGSRVHNLQQSRNGEIAESEFGRLTFYIHCHIARDMDYGITYWRPGLSSLGAGEDQWKLSKEGAGEDPPSDSLGRPGGQISLE